MISAPDLRPAADGRAVARLAVLDPGGTWSRWEALQAAEPATAPLQVEPLARGPVPESDAVLVLVPAKGLDRRQYEWVRKLDLSGPALLFAASLARSDLILTGRNDPGHLELIREIEREFGSPLLPVPEESEPGFVPALLRLARERGLLEAASRQTRELMEALVAITGGGPFDQEGPETLAAVSGLDILAGSLTGALQAELLSELLELVVVQAGADRQRAGALEAGWNELAANLRDECARLARGARFHGDMAEELVAGMDEAIQAVARELDAWTDPPFPELAAWSGNARRDLKTPQICMPVVGVFSSGKTTLFNHLLGKTPKGLPFLRTSSTHNTALLCRFLPRREGRNRMELSYRSHFQMTLISPDWPLELAVYARTPGTIQLLRQRADGGHLALLATPEGLREWIFIDRDKRLLPKISVGARLSPGDPLTEGLRAQDWESRYLEDRLDLRVEVRVRAARSLIDLLRRNALRDARLILRLRVPDGRRSFKLEPLVLSQEETPKGFRSWLGWLDGFARDEAWWRNSDPEKGLARLPSTRHPSPIELRLEARVDPAGLPAAHDLETDEDWDWFQGSATPESTRQNRRVGFSESPTAAYLVEKADLYLDSPLFQLVSLVDTPGLHSITELHERITEEFIHQGQTFILLCRLDRGSYEEATARALGAMLTSLAEQQVPRSEVPQRIFLVLNWFRGDALAGRNDAQARRLVEDFRELASRILGSATLRLYVVDLSPAAFHQHERPATLLGHPSLRRLIDDLHGFLMQQGLSPRLSGMASSLRRVWTEKASALDRREKDLEGAGSSLEEIRSAMQQLEPEGALRTGLRTRVETRFNDLLSPVRSLRKGLEALSDKGDFERFQASGVNLMREYNTSRQLLADALTSEINAALGARLGNALDQVPRLAGVAEEVHKLPTMADQSFLKTVGSIVAGWPSGLARFWKLLTNLEFHRTTKRKELIQEYLPDSRVQEIERIARSGREKLTSQIDKACEEGLEALRERQKRAKASDEQRRKELKKIEAEREKLSGFKPRYHALLQVLEGTKKVKKA